MTQQLDPGTGRPYKPFPKLLTRPLNPLLVPILSMIESNNGLRRYGDWIPGSDKSNPANARAWGILQQWKIFLDEVNRRAHTNDSPQSRLDDDRSKARTGWYLQHIRDALEKKFGRPFTDAELARVYNGGPGGWNKAKTDRYEKLFNHGYQYYVLGGDPQKWDGLKTEIPEPNIPNLQAGPASTGMYAPPYVPPAAPSVAAKPASTTAAPAARPSAPVQQPQPVYKTIKPGDTVHGLWRASGGNKNMKWADFYAQFKNNNPGIDPKNLRVGQQYR